MPDISYKYFAPLDTISGANAVRIVPNIIYYPVGLNILSIVFSTRNLLKLSL